MGKIVTNMFTSKVTEEMRVERRAIKAKTKGALPTIPEIEEALRAYRGNITKAAEVLDLEGPVLRRKVNATPSLVKAMKDIEEEKLDETEEVLDELVKEKNVTAVTFRLRMKGKERGYSEKSVVEHEIGESPRSAAALIAAMQRGAKALREEEEVIDVESRLLEVKSEDA